MATNRNRIFVIIRLDGSLPKEVISKLKREKRELLRKSEMDSRSSGRRPELRELVQKRIFKKYKNILDKGETGPTWLSIPEVAEIVEEAIHFRDETKLSLYAYSIMPNHVHIVFKDILNNKDTDPADSIYPISNMLGSLKKFTARQSNKILNRTGHPFWQSESYDHVIRDPYELERIIYYTLYNPVKAGLVSDWQDWPYSYCKEEFSNYFTGSF